MIGFIKKLLKSRAVQTKSAPKARVRPVVVKPRPNTTNNAELNPGGQASKPDAIALETSVDGRIESNGPGKNVLVQNEYQRENSGVLEELSILDESAEDSNSAGGIDPYNTGQFDRSKNWDKRFRK